MSKGHTNNPAGRPKGTPNKVGAELRERISNFVSERWPQFEEDFDDLEPKERMLFLEKLMAYTLPKLQAVAVDHQGAAHSLVWNEIKTYEGSPPTITIFKLPDNGRSFDPSKMTDEELRAALAEEERAGQE